MIPTLVATDTSLTSPPAPNESIPSDSESSNSSDTSELDVDLLSCADVCYENKDGIHGVSYLDSSSKSWMDTSCWLEEKEDPTIWIRLTTVPSSPSCKAINHLIPQPLVIPETSHVKFTIHDRRPGLQVRTRSTMNWVPIASRGPNWRSSYCSVIRVHASINHWLFMSSFVATDL